MICPDSDLDCDNPGCRRGGCQGRRPKLPLFRAPAISAAGRLPLFEPATAGEIVALQAPDRTEDTVRRRQLVTA